MKKFRSLLALGLTLGILAGCSSQPTSTESTASTTLPPQTTAAPVETTVPPETTLPPEPVVVDVTLELPEGFDADVVQDDLTVYGSPSPRDESNITVTVLPRDETVLELTSEEFKAQYPTRDDSDLTEDDSQPLQFRLYDLYPTEVDGWQALYADFGQTFDDYSAHTYFYEVVTTEANYRITFTDCTDDNDYLADYAECAGTIRFILDTEEIIADYSGLTLYTLDCGLKLYAESGLEEHNAEGFSACLGNANVILLLMADNKAENNLTQMDIAGYAELLCQTNDLDGFDEDIYGTLCTTFYSTDDTGMEYYNMLCVKETADAFWVCQMTCLSSDQASYAKEFALWASSVEPAN